MNNFSVTGITRFGQGRLFFGLIVTLAVLAPLTPCQKYSEAGSPVNHIFGILQDQIAKYETSSFFSLQNPQECRYFVFKVCKL